jgi:MFS family permease
VITNEQRKFSRLYYLWMFLSSAHFPLAIAFLYYHYVLGLSFTNASALMLANWCALIAFDTYGGKLADKHGQKRIYIIGTMIYIAGTIAPVLFLRNFGLLCLLAVIGGFGLALASNALHASAAAIFHDNKRQFQRLNANGQMVLFLSRTVAAPIGGWLYVLSPQLPYIALGVSLILSAILVSIMPIPAVTPHSDKQPSVSTVAREMYIKHPYVWRVILVAAACSFSINILFAHYQPYFDAHGLSPLTISYIFAAISLASALGSWLVQHLHLRKRRLSILFWCNSVICIASIAFMLQSPLLVIIAALVIGVASGAINPTLRLSVSEHIRPSVRTTALSVATTVTAIGSMTSFQLSSYLTDHASSAAIAWVTISGGTLCVLIFLHQGKRNPAVKPEVSAQTLPAQE